MNNGCNHWTMKDIKSLLEKSNGKLIRKYNSKLIDELLIENDKTGKVVSKYFKKRSKEKDWIAENLLMWCNEHVVQLTQEHKFHPKRKWRFDYAIPDLKIAIEYEGLISKKSRHTTITGFTKDTEKYNAAIKGGWKVFRYTAINYRNLINDLDNIIDNHLKLK